MIRKSGELSAESAAAESEDRADSAATEGMQTDRLHPGQSPETGGEVEDDSSEPMPRDRVAVDDPASPATRFESAELAALLECPFDIRVVFAEKSVSAEDLGNYSQGSVMVLPGVEPERLVLEIEGTPVAWGVAVTVGEQLAIQIREVLDPRALLEKLPRSTLDQVLRSHFVIEDGDTVIADGDAVVEDGDTP